MKIWNFLHRTVCGRQPDHRKHKGGHSSSPGKSSDHGAENVTEANAAAAKNTAGDDKKDKDDDDDDDDDMGKWIFWTINS